MYNNQDILKKHTALAMSRKDVDTSLILFPVRVETRFVDKYSVEDVYEPDKALYAFQRFWYYVTTFEENNDSQRLSMALSTMETIESLDSVYREDRRRLLNIARKIVDATNPQGELRMMWNRILVHIPRLSTLDVVSDNEATEYLRRLQVTSHAIKRMSSFSGFGGKTATRYKVAKERMKECLQVIEKLLPADEKDSIVNRFSLITKKQYLKFLDATSFFKDSVDHFGRVFSDLCPANETYVPSQRRYTDPLLEALDKQFEQYNVYRERYYGYKPGTTTVAYKNRKQSLRDKMQSKIGEYNRYTRFAELMILWRLRMLTGLKRDEATTVRVEKWRQIADNTIFSFHEEREWLISVLGTYNRYKEENDLQNKISKDRLNRHTKVIRKRKLCYRKQMKCLLVRIYPDQIAITQALKPITLQESQHTQEFWIRFFMAGDDDLAKKAAWEALCSLYTPPRAAYLAKAVLPAQDKLSKLKSNIESFVKKGLSYEKLGENDKKEYLLPYLNNYADDSDQVFSVPVTELLPDRFVLQANLDNGQKKGEYIVQYGHLIPRTLQVGMDLNNQPILRSDGSFTGNLRWMTNYREAESMGMAITLPLDPYTKKGSGTFHFNSIYVMGMKELSVNNDADSTFSSDVLRTLFNSHLYSQEGLDLLKIGTPTNILSDEDMQLSEKDSEYDTGKDALANEFYKKVITPLSKPEGIKATGAEGDASIISSLFGLNQVKPVDNPFCSVLGKDNIEVRKENVVKEAFLNTLSGVHPILNHILNNYRLNNYFLKNVSPLGVYPSLRIGSQPYGIVPVCDFKNLQFGVSDPLLTLKRILLLLTDRWNELSETSVISETNMNKSQRRSTEESYLKAISATPISTSFYDRVQVKDSDILTPEYFKGKRYDLKPFDEVYVKLKRSHPTLDKKKLKSEYLPSFGNIPLTDDYLAKQKDNFTWGTLKASIKKQVDSKLGAGTVSDQELERLITATFDLFNYRLDAWMTGLLNHRMLQRINSRGTHKISIGAYGWVFNLWEDKKEPVSEEFVLAPSINHAVTAAVLRSSFNRAAEGERKDYSLSVNMSSSRVRQALRIIQGVRNGLSLGTILGSDLERLLHDDNNRPGGKEMDFFIYYLRKAYPLNNTSYQYSSSADAKRDSSLDVLNGVALLEDLRDEKRMTQNRKHQLTAIYNWKIREGQERLWPWLKKIFNETDTGKIRGLVPDFDAKINRLVILIQEMEDSYDALSDVVTAETVYKLTEGNTAAVDALMNSMNTGRNFPEPDVTEIPMFSAHIERRVIVGLNQDSSKYTSDESYFQQVEPFLDNWMGDMLGFDRITAQIKRDGAVVNVPLGKGGLGLTPSELVYLSGDWDVFRHFLKWLYWYKNPAPTDNVGITLDEAELAVDSMRELLSRARPLKQEDFAVSTIPIDDSFDYKKRKIDITYELEELACDLHSDSIYEQVEEMQRVNYTPDKSLFRITVGNLLKFFRLGMTDALSCLNDYFLNEEIDKYRDPEDYAELTSQWMTLYNNVNALGHKLWEKVEKFREEETATEAVKQLFLPSFILVPGFYTTNNPVIDVDAFKKQCSSKFSFDNVDRSVIEDDLMSLADVRPQMAALHQLRLYGKVNGIKAATDVKPFQLESESPRDKSWMGAEVKNPASVRDANVYEVFNLSNFMIDDDLINGLFNGLVLDYWVEKIPYQRQTAALAFSYDQPDAEPPQAILVGVSTLKGKHRWSGQRMLRAIHSAMYQVKSRAVEPEHLYADNWTSGFLPLLNINPDDTLKTNK
ncbi:MAG: hypothetical protein K5850_02225 [Bacteroidales bacterium]|nr:hypothetical protein [Bacteroidales bacterium]